MRIAISQRVDTITEYVEQRDSLDQAWTKLFNQTDFQILPVPNNLNNVVKWLEMFGVEGILLSGGNDLGHLSGSNNYSLERDKIENILLEWAFKKKVPVLGVCRGMQKINYYLGGSLSRIENHSKTKHKITIIQNEVIEKTLSEVNSFHNWGIMKNDLSPNLRAIAIAYDGSIEGVMHINLPWFGIMWHPERNLMSEINIEIEFLKKVFFKKKVG